MKQCIRTMLVALCALCTLTVFALAAPEETGIHVQLNGQELEFTDAAPVSQDGRTFLPYRAVFEAMGAEVGYQDDTISAKRGDTLLSMTIGSTAASVSRGGVTETLTMDVAPYVDNTTWRTYVPVRFAADAFGCIVGWDQAANTVILVDPQALVDTALAEKEFTLLESLSALNEKYETGNWNVDSTMGADVALLGSEQVSVLSGTMTGIVSPSTGEVNAKMNVDLTALMTQLAAALGGTLEDLGATAEDLTMDMTMDMKLDLDKGQICYRMDDATNAAMGLNAGTWLTFDLADMDELMAQAGIDMDYEALMAAAAEAEAMSPKDLLTAVLSEISLDDRAADGYTTLAATLDTVFSALSDEGFQKTETGYETSLELTLDEGVGVSAAIDLTAGKDGKVTGYNMYASMDLPVPADATGDAQGAPLPLPEKLGLSLYMSMDQDGKQSVVIGLTAGQMMAMEMTIDMTLTAAHQAPALALPEGAETVDLRT